MKRAITTILFLLLATPAWAVKPVQIFTRSLVAGQTTVAYSTTVKAKFGTKPYTWSIGSGALPTGLNIAGATGVISGTPTVAGTFNFVVHIVDSAGSPTTDDKGLYIVISASAPPPTPAVSITTTSVPNGVVGAAYSTTLQATGGTAPYTWTQPAGVLPPATTLTGATGTIAGTLTVAGTYSFTARVTDSSPTPQTFDRALVATIATGGTYLFSDALTSLAAWSFVWKSSENNPTIAACPGGGTCAQIHYVICGDSTNPVCGASHQDLNRYVTTNKVRGLSEFYARAYLYQKTPEPGGSLLVGRKLIWAEDFNHANFSHMFSALGVGSTLRLTVGTNGSTACGVTSRATYLVPTLNYNTWYSLEVHWKLNTAGLSDGVVEVWIDGVQAVTESNWNFRGTCTSTYDSVSFGRQVDRPSYAYPVDEYRYWKNAVVNTTGPIGP